MRYVSTLLLVMTLLLPGSAFGGDKIGGKYQVIGDLEKLKGTQSIKMVEFFNYSCGHCYRFLDTSKRLQAKYKDKLLHKKYPIYWGNQTPYPARAFYIADELGIEKEFTQKLFDTNFKLNINIFQPRVIRFVAKEFGVEKQMEAGMQSEKIIAKVQKSLDLAKKYEANETPTIIINDVLKVAPSMSEGNVETMTDNLDLIFQDILSYN
ncbi:MAG: DsbA family protein [Nitrospinaceae bacterium]